MKLMTLVACATLLSLVAAAAVAADKVPAAKNVPAGARVSVTLPGDNFHFKPGAGAQQAEKYCLTCHSSAYVSTQPTLDKAHWDAEVTKMRKAYGAAIPDQEAAEIVDYLTATYGKPS